MIRSRTAWIVTAAVLTAPTEGRAETACPVVVRSCPPGAVVAMDPVAGVSFVDLQSGMCIEPWWTVRVPVTVSQAATSGSSAPAIGEGIVWIVGGTIVLVAFIAAVAIYNVRVKALQTELKKVTLRDRRCSAAREVASLCSVVLALLEVPDTGEHGLEPQRRALKVACESYQDNAPST